MSDSEQGDVLHYMLWTIQKEDYTYKEQQVITMCLAPKYMNGKTAGPSMACTKFASDPSIVCPNRFVTNSARNATIKVMTPRLGEIIGRPIAVSRLRYCRSDY